MAGIDARRPLLGPAAGHGHQVHPPHRGADRSPGGPALHQPRARRHHPRARPLRTVDKPAMRILVLQNDPISPAGTVEDRLHAAGAELDLIKPLHGDPLPAVPDGYAGAVVLGGAMSANDDDKYPA